MPRSTAILLLLVIAGLLIAADKPEAAAPRAPAAPPQERQPGGWWSGETSQFLFFATIEGLYEDGVPQDVVDIIVPPVELRIENPQRRSYTPPPRAGEPVVRNSNDHFVYTCPMCHPVSEAFLLYAKREPFRGQKDSDVNTFGTRGLPENLLKGLRSKNKVERIEALRDVINRWTTRRLDRMRLTDKERTEWETRIKFLRDQGTQALQNFQKGLNGDYFKNAYADWKFCPSCDGGLNACKLKPEH